MEQIHESLSKLSELTPEELSTLTESIISEFDALDEATSEVPTSEAVEQMTQLAAALDSVKSEQANREVQAQELAAAKDEAVKRVRGEQVDESVEDAPEVEETEEKSEDVFSADEESEPVKEESAELATETEESAELSADTEDAPAVEAETESELAVTEEVVEEAPEAELAADETTETEVETPEVSDAAELAVEDVETPEEVETDLSAAEETPEVTEEAGVEETELSQGKDSEADMSASVDNESPEVQAPDTHRPVVATTTVVERADVAITAAGKAGDMKSLSEAMAFKIGALSRSVGGDGEQEYIGKIEYKYSDNRTLGNSVEENDEKIRAVASPEAIVAAGGFCAPVEVSYDVFGFGTDRRPVKDALAAFSAGRGGIRYTTSPVLGDLTDAVSTWTLQDDIDAATPGGPEPTKPCLRVNCGQEVVVYTDAIPLCLTIGNLQTRAFPEQVARNNDLAFIEHARYAETRILTRIGALSTSVSASSKLGASRDFFVQLEKAAAAYRSRHRLDPAERLRVILPAWFKNLVRADITMSMPAGSDEDRFGIPDNIVDRWFAARHINVTWTLDGETGQIFGSQDEGTLDSFPTDLVWYLFSEGTFLFLDGGELDLGLVRDSSLNSTNDYKMFVETFEGVAKVGIESLRVTTQIDLNGASAGTIDPATL